MRVQIIFERMLFCDFEIWFRGEKLESTKLTNSAQAWRFERLEPTQISLSSPLAGVLLLRSVPRSLGSLWRDMLCHRLGVMRPFPTELGQFPLRRGRDVEKTQRNYCVFPRRLAISLSACCNRNALRVFPRGHQVDGLPRASSLKIVLRFPPKVWNT